MDKAFYIIDGHAQIHRAYHAPGANLRGPSGEPTKAIYYFVRMLMRLCREQRPHWLAMAVDPGKDQLWRRELMPSYKAHREKRDPALVSQLLRCREITRDLGVPVLESPRDEADDIIATLAHHAGDRQVVIVSRDKDLMSLVSPTCRLYDPFSSEFIDEAYVVRKFGVPPRLVSDLLALCGDSTDGVPGIDGVGPKTAASLLRKHGSLRKLLGHPDYSPEKDKLLLYYKLTCLNREAPIDLPPSLRFRGLNLKAAGPIFRELGFRQWE